MPTVTIITPILNAEPFLQEAINSVLAQTLTDWELLLLDDGSTDQSRQIAAAAARDDKRIIAFDRPDGAPSGAAAARNRGIAAARADLVAFLDADDILEPEKLALETALFKRHPEAAMVYGPTLWFREGSPTWLWLEPIRREAGRLHSPPSLVAKVILAMRWHVPCTCAVTVRTEILRAVGGFEEWLRLYEDQTLYAKIFLRYPVYVHNRCVARYRQNSSSVSAEATKSGEYRRDSAHGARAVFLDWLDGHVVASGLATDEIRRELRLARLPYTAPGSQPMLDRATLWLRALPARVRSAMKRQLRKLGGRGRQA